MELCIFVLMRGFIILKTGFISNGAVSFQKGAAHFYLRGPRKAVRLFGVI
jgi:hypothetical protein